MIRLAFAAMLIAASISFGPAWCAETINFDSVTPTSTTQLMRREYPAAKVSIPGQLHMPRNAAGRIPAMVIKHGSGGVTEAREDAWAGRLNVMGIAGFVVDSFGPRNIKSTAEDQSVLAIDADVADSLAALRTLARDPRIDPQRIGIIGFSRGGQAALYAALDPIRKGIIDDGTRFALVAAFYPGCSTRYVSTQINTAAIGLFHGAADDYTSPTQCREYVEWFKSKGVPVSIHLYLGAYHNFDMRGPVIRAPRVQTGRGCSAEFDLEAGTLRRLDTGARVDRAGLAAYFNSCRQLGAQLGGNPAALIASINDLTAFLKAGFKMP
jgi:dienelactone hydrolase